MTNELTAERLRDLVARIMGESLQKSDTPIDMLAFYIVNAAPQIIAMMEREARMREALEALCDQADHVVLGISVRRGGQEFTGAVGELRQRVSAARAAIAAMETDDASE